MQRSQPPNALRFPRRQTLSFWWRMRESAIVALRIATRTTTRTVVMLHTGVVLDAPEVRVQQSPHEHQEIWEVEHAVLRRDGLECGPPCLDLAEVGLELSDRFLAEGDDGVDEALHVVEGHPEPALVIVRAPAEEDIFRGALGVAAAAEGLPEKQLPESLDLWRAEARLLHHLPQLHVLRIVDELPQVPHQHHELVEMEAAVSVRVDLLVKVLQHGPQSTRVRHLGDLDLHEPDDVCCTNVPEIMCVVLLERFPELHHLLRRKAPVVPELLPAPPLGLLEGEDQPEHGHRAVWTLGRTQLLLEGLPHRVLGEAAGLHGGDLTHRDHGVELPEPAGAPHVLPHEGGHDLPALPLAVEAHHLAQLRQVEPPRVVHVHLPDDVAREGEGHDVAEPPQQLPQLRRANLARALRVEPRERLLDLPVLGGAEALPRAVDGEQLPHGAQVHGRHVPDAGRDRSLPQRALVGQVAQHAHEAGHLVHRHHAVPVRIAEKHVLPDLGHLALPHLAHADQVLAPVQGAAAVDVDLGQDLSALRPVAEVAQPAHDGGELLGVDLARLVVIEHVIHAHKLLVLPPGETFAIVNQIHHGFELFKIQRARPVWVGLLVHLVQDVPHRLDPDFPKKVRELVLVYGIRAIRVAPLERVSVSLLLPLEAAAHELDEVVHADRAIRSELVVDIVHHLRIHAAQAGQLEREGQVIVVDLAVVLHLLEHAPPQRLVLDLYQGKVLRAC
mmetsp:Transcript_17364/g.49133  ORF Transcript_17364/g.49133 Transcript_17364/m.49133 type:complete len:727 (-) Transcript_17364:175-2355(-)